MAGKWVNARRARFVLIGSIVVAVALGLNQVYQLLFRASDWERMLLLMRGHAVEAGAAQVVIYDGNVSVTLLSTEYKERFLTLCQRGRPSASGGGHRSYLGRVDWDDGAVSMFGLSPFSDENRLSVSVWSDSLGPIWNFDVDVRDIDDPGGAIKGVVSFLMNAREGEARVL